jgi:hypothetical protein
MSPCYSAKGNWRYGETYLLHLQVQQTNKKLGLLPASYWFHLRINLRPWRWKRSVSLKTSASWTKTQKTTKYACTCCIFTKILDTGKEKQWDPEAYTTEPFLSGINCMECDSGNIITEVTPWLLWNLRTILWCGGGDSLYFRHSKSVLRRFKKSSSSSSYFVTDKTDQELA